MATKERRKARWRKLIFTEVWQTWTEVRSGSTRSLPLSSFTTLSVRFTRSVNEGDFFVDKAFTASSFRIWNSSTGIPSPPLALFVVMLPKAHLTSHLRMSGSRWVITPSWLSGSWRSFLYSSSVYSCHLFLISSAYVRSIPFLFFIEPIFAWNVPLVSRIFLKRSLVLPILLFFSISLHWSLRKAFLSLLAILWNSALKWVYLKDRERYSY